MIVSVLSIFWSWFTSGGLSEITRQISSAKTEALNAQTEQDRIVSNERIQTLQAQRDVLLAEVASGGPASWMRPLFASIFIVYNFKVVVWDKVLGLGTTDPLSTELFQIEMIVILALFAGRSAEKITRIVKSK